MRASIIMTENIHNISLVKENDLDGCIEFLKRTFFVDEPLNKSAGLNYDCKELEDMCRHGLSSGFSLKCTDTSGAIIAVTVTEYQDKNSKDTLVELEEVASACENEKFKKVLQVLIYRENEAKIWEKYPSFGFLDIFAMATDAAHLRKGIAKAMLLETEKLGRQLENVGMIRVDTSSAYSARAVEKIGFKEVYKKKFKDIFINGEPILVPDLPHIFISSYVKILNN